MNKHKTVITFFIKAKLLAVLQTAKKAIKLSQLMKFLTLILLKILQIKYDN